MRTCERFEVYKVFFQYSDGPTGYIRVRQLRKCFKSVGLGINRKAWGVIARRYGGKQQQMNFDDFAVCAAKIFNIHETFRRLNTDTGEPRNLTMEEWMEECLYH
ncbi:hypothetical protein LSAT2_013289 [Lamellibrachia satsuma]|nr:hypothetical protein LSAT2_013289 [Lamellibrachia satsuma]